MNINLKQMSVVIVLVGDNYYNKNENDVDRYRDICDINSMRRDTKKIKKVYTAKSESRFTVYESKSMVKQEWYTDLLEKSSLKGIARGTQLRREAKDRRSFSNLIL